MTFDDVIEVVLCYDPAEITVQTGTALMLEDLCLFFVAIAKRNHP
ncbi:hypothetical protein NO559_16365 [Dasania sp. GY-MA-18]|nr:hypothetical protein [Dasania sp. GY-MA-18]MCR8924350.1 hypothetical protein [Dasania sp. GY-MA-18]